MTDHDLLGTRVGHIRIVDLLGEGGMGSVYVGFDERLQRRVALKALQQGRLDEEAKARFLREARVLSQLKHPHICQIHDFQEGPDRDFLVLELIEGKNLKEVITSKPDPALRMHIARQIAEVLVATHAKGIIHRDLKPANVMVTPDGEVKVLDFGLAREATLGSEDETRSRIDTAASGAPDKTDSSVTRLGVVLGTLSYMSPEQARGEPVTTASDMYSYGLVLQELFTEKSASLPGSSADEQLQKAKAGETVPVEGLDRDLTALINRLKDPAAAVRPTALDTVDWLDRIEAKPRKKRRRALVWGAGTVLALVAVGMSYQAFRIKRQALRIEEEAKRANQEAQSAKEVSEFLVKLFEVSDPGQSRGDTVTARELLDKAGRDIEGRLTDQPLIKARLELTLGRVYDSLGLFDPALTLAEKSLALRRQQLPGTDSMVAESLHKLGDIRYDRGEYDAAGPLLRSAAEIQEKALGPEDPALALTLNDLAGVYVAQERLSDAEPLFLRALRIREKALGPNHQDVAESLANLAWLYNRQRKLAEAEPLYLRALTIQKNTLGADHPDVATTLNNLALLYMAEAKYAQAAPLLLRALAIDEKTLGPRHPSLATELGSLGVLYRDTARYAEAEPMLLRAVSIEEKALGPNHPSLATTLEYLGVVYSEEGKYAQAKPLLLRAVAITEKALGTSHPEVALALNNLAELYREEGQFAQEEPLYLRAIAIDEKARGRESLETASDLVLLADLYRREGKPADPLLERALKVCRATLPIQDADRFSCAKAFALSGRTAEASVQAQELLAQGFRRKAFLELCEKLGMKTTS